MANYDRGVYEPPSEDIRVFDGGEDDIDDEGSRLPLLIVIALLVLAAFAGVVWLAYTQGVQRGRSDAPRIIAASPGPDKVAPENGGEANPYQGLKIYQQPAPPDEEVADDETPSEQQANTSAPDLRPQQTEAKPQQAEAQPQPATAPPRSLAKPAPQKAPAVPAVAPVATATAPAATPVLHAATGSMMLQIGSYKSQEEASAAWTTYQKKHPIAGGYSSDVKQVDLGDKGTWYRLRMGPFDSKAAASEFCDKLKADGASCFPAAP